MSWKKFFTGEPMPDKNDPKYRDQLAVRQTAELGPESQGAGSLAGLGLCHFLFP